MLKVLFVCLGNICRSPTAEAVVSDQLIGFGLQDLVQLDSAGTAGWHIGKSPDKRTQAAAKKRNYDMSLLRARQVEPEDFFRFDYVLAMDEDNLKNLRMIEPEGHNAKLDLFLSYIPSADCKDVPDPYYGGEGGFNLVLDLVEEGGLALIEELRSKL